MRTTYKCHTSTNTPPPAKLEPCLHLAKMGGRWVCLRLMRTMIGVDSNPCWKPVEESQ